ncbi:MAG: YfhO family protein [Acidobacteriota bacterium]
MILLTVLGITLPALATFAAVRKWVMPVPWRNALGFLFLTFAFLHGAVFTSKVPVPVDEVARGYPYRGLFGDVIAKNPMTNDTARLFLPWMQTARQELAQGHLPLWNRHAFSGYPLLANAEAAPFSPLFLSTLFVPLPKQIVAMAGLKVFFALLFTFLFLRREGVSEGAATFGAVAYAFSSFQTVTLYYSTSAVTALLPAVVFSVFHALERPARSSIVFVAATVATIFANGHPESVLHVAIAVAVLLAIDLAFEKRVIEGAGRPGSNDHRRWLTSLRAPLSGALCGAAIALPIWLPAAQQVLLSTRYADLRAAKAMAPIPFTAIWAMLNPNGFGNPARHNWSWILNYMTVSESYVGLLVLVLFGCAAVSRHTTGRSRAWIVAAVVLFLVAMNWTPIGHLLNAVPPLSVAANDKLRFVTCFLAACVAAKFVDGAEVEARLNLVLVSLPLAGLAIYVYEKQLRLLRPSDLAGVAAVSLFLAAAIWPGRRRAPAWTACVLTTAELFAFNANFNRLVDAKYFRPSLPIIAALWQHAPREPFRVTGYDWVFLPNAAAQYGLEDIRGSDPMSYASYTRVLGKIAAVEPGTDVARVIDVEGPLIDFLNTRFLLAEPGASPREKWQLLYRGADGSLFENRRVQPRFFAPGARVGIEARSSSEFRLRISTPKPVRIESSQPLGPGWMVSLGGAQVSLRRVNEAFMGFDVPAGESEAVVSYMPMAFYGALPVALAGLLALGISGGKRSFGALE